MRTIVCDRLAVSIHHEADVQLLDTLESILELHIPCSSSLQRNSSMHAEDDRVKGQKSLQIRSKKHVGKLQTIVSMVKSVILASMLLEIRCLTVAHVICMCITDTVPMTM